MVQLIIYWKYPSPKLISMFWMGRLIILSFVLSSTCLHHFSWWFQFWSGYHQLTAGCLKNTGVRLDVVLYQLYQLSAVIRYAINNTGRAGWSSQLVMHIQGAPIKNFYIYGIVADFFTRFMLFTEDDLGHVSSKLHLNIWFDSKIITIWT